MALLWRWLVCHRPCESVNSASALTSCFPSRKLSKARTRAEREPRSTTNDDAGCSRARAADAAMWGHRRRGTAGARLSVRPAASKACGVRQGRRKPKTRLPGWRRGLFCDAVAIGQRNVESNPWKQS